MWIYGRPSSWEDFSWRVILLGTFYLSISGLRPSFLGTVFWTTRFTSSFAQQSTRLIWPQDRASIHWICNWSHRVDTILWVCLIIENVVLNWGRTCRRNRLRIVSLYEGRVYDKYFFPFNALIICLLSEIWFNLFQGNSYYKSIHFDYDYYCWGWILYSF